MDVKVKIEDNVTEAKEVFKNAYAHFRESLKHFVLDGYVTEHSQMKQNISKLYKNLIFFESDKSRVLAMNEKRVESIKPLVQMLSQSAYPKLWQECC